MFDTAYFNYLQGGCYDNGKIISVEGFGAGSSAEPYLRVVLMHDEYYFANSSGWAIHSSGTVYSVTIPVKEGDNIYATSFGAAGENGGNKAGIRVTFLDDYDVVKSLTPAETYAEFSVDGYLTVPEGAKYINIPMWMNSDAWEIYNLSLEHVYDTVITAPTCTEQGYTTHTCERCKDSYVDSYVAKLNHSYGNWTVRKAATCTEEGTEGRDCANCDHYETREVEALGHLWEEEMTVDKTSSSLESGSMSIHCARCEATKDTTLIPMISSADRAKKIVYTGSGNIPDIVIKDTDGRKLVEGIDYTYVIYDADGNIVISPSEVGMYTIEIMYQGKYSGIESLQYAIVPAAPKSVKLKRSAHDDVKVSWDKVTGAKGYYVYYKKSSAEKYSSYKVTTGTSLTISGLSKNTKYAFKIVPYGVRESVKVKSDNYIAKSITTLKK